MTQSQLRAMLLKQGFTSRHLAQLLPVSERTLRRFLKGASIGTATQFIIVSKLGLTPVKKGKI